MSDWGEKGAMVMILPAQREEKSELEGKWLTYNYTDWGPWGCDRRKLLKFSIALEHPQNPQSPRLHSKLATVTSGSLRRKCGMYSGRWDVGQRKGVRVKLWLGLFQGPTHPGPWTAVWGAGDESEREHFSCSSCEENVRLPSSQLPRTMEWGGRDQ